MNLKTYHQLVSTGCIVMLLPLLGCGNDRPQTVSVTGKLTYGGGDWPAPGKIYFTTLEPASGYDSRPGTAAFDSDGQFSAGTWEANDGLIPGTYRVTIKCWKKEPTVESPTVISYVPKEFQVPSESTWEIEVKPDGGAVVIEKDIPKFEG